MKHIALRLGAALAAAGCAASAAAAEKVRIAGNFPVEHSSSAAMEIFQQELETATGGELTADLFPAMQLGGAQENVDQVRSGTIFGIWIGIAYLSRTVPELEAVSLPFVFPDRETAFGVIDSKVGDLLSGRRLHHAGADVRADRARLSDRPPVLRLFVRAQPGGRHDDAAGRRAVVRDVRHHPDLVGRAGPPRMAPSWCCSTACCCSAWSSRAWSQRCRGRSATDPPFLRRHRL